MPRVEFYGGPLHGREGETQHWVHEFKVPIRPPINEHLLTCHVTYKAIAVLPDRIVFLFPDEHSAALQYMMRKCNCWTVAYFMYREKCFEHFLQHDPLIQSKLLREISVDFHS